MRNLPLVKIALALFIISLVVLVIILAKNILVPLAISLLVGNLIWGIAGMLIVIPYIAILKIIMRNIESLHPFAYLLSSKGLEKNIRLTTAGVLDMLK